MLRDFNKFMRRTSSKNEEVENTPVNPRDSLSSASTSSDVSRPPLHTIQDSAPTRNPKFEHDPVTTRSNKIERTPTKTVKPKTSDHTLPLRTPDRHGMGFSAKNKFGWANKNDHTQSESRDDLRNTTPRGNRAGGRASSNCSESNSTQSTPTKSVSKPPNSGLRSKFDWNGNGSARGGSFASLYRGLPIPSGPATVVNTIEVPHFDLKEDPSFWMDHNVQVLIRVRPLNSMEKGANGYNRCLKQESAQSITWIGQPENRFTFDHVACETVDQETLFRMAGLPMVENCLSGYNSCVFAYGQTGSGKTYTMLGELEDLEVKPSPHRGMTPRIFEFLFARIQAEEESRRDEKLKYNCKCSFLEIYNEQITDLLDPTSTNLLLREDVKKGVYVENLSEFEVRTVSDILKLLTQGSLNRKVAATNMNRESSRSHSVFTCVIESQWEKDSTTNLRFARLNLVDLAGSERQKSSGAEGERLKEAANINKSLSTLGHVIMILADVANGKQRHIPYRDSRLTFLLQDSLGGNSKTMIIANVSPSICCSAETLNTLKFAQRAKLIQNNAVVNEDSNGDVIALQHQIRLLKEEISLLKRQNISRSLSFGSAAVDPVQAGGDVCTGNTHAMDQQIVDLDLEYESKAGVRMSTKQLQALETTLAGALRREQMAETSIKKLEAEIEQLNRLVRQREEDTRSTKMMLRFREDKIQRMESLLGGSLATDSYLLDENKALSEENQLLQAKVDKNPEVTRFALENIRLLDQLRRFQEFYEEGERDLLLTEVSKLRGQLLQFLNGNSKQNSSLNSNIPSEEAVRMSKEYNGLHSELNQTICELEKCKLNLNTCLEDNTKLQREIRELQSKLKSLTAASHGQANNTRNAQVMNEEEILILQLELDIVKIILKEERSSRAEIEEREMCLYRDFEAAKHQLLLMSKRYEDANIELKEAKSVIEALESQQILSIDEMEDLRKSNSDYENRVRELELEIIAFKEQLSRKDLRDLLYSGNSRRENASLQSRLKRMHDSLDNAKRLNLFYQKDRDNLASNEEEMDEVRRQVEAETAEVIVCLQEELTILQQQVEDGHSKEMDTKGRMMLLESQLREQREKISNLTEYNQRLATELEQKERELRILSEEWELLASEVEEILVHGNETLIDASDQLDLISSSFPQKRIWISEQVGRLTRIVCEKELLIEELGRCLEEANDKRSDVECMLKSLKGAALVINEARQQECDEKEKEIIHLMSELSEKSSKVRELELRMMMAEHRISEVSKCATVAFVVINRLSETAGNHLNALKEKDIRLKVSAEMNLKKDNLLSDKTAVVEDAEKQILYLRNEVAELEETCTDLRLKLSEEKQHSSALEQKIEHIEENDIFTTREKLSELQAGVSTLKSCMNLSSEYRQSAVMNNSQEDSTCFHDNKGRKSDVKSMEDFVDIRNDTSDYPSEEGKNFCGSLSGQKPTESRKACKDLKDKDVTILLLKKEIESALLSLSEVQVEMAKLRNEKEEMLVSKKLNEKSLTCITAQVMTLKAAMNGFEKQLQVQTEVVSHKLQALERTVRETRTYFYQAKEVLELEVGDAKMIAAQKTAESSCIFAKFEEAQYTMKEADVMINELIIANETTKLEIERLKQNEFKLVDERDTLIDEVRCLQSINDSKDQQLEDLEKQFGSNLSETRDLVLELEGIVADVQTSFREKFMPIAQDFQCMKSQLLDSTRILRSWLENIWSEMIVKDCALSVLHLCHMGILLETVTGQNAENVLLQHGLSESNALIADLREHNSKSKKELDMCSVLKGKLLADIKDGFDRISRKEEETGELSVRLFTFEKKISDIQLQEELMFERSNYIGSQLANLVKELESSNINIMASLLNEEKLLKDKEDVLISEADLLMLDFCSKDIESFVLASELAEMSLQNAETERVNRSYCYVVENLKKEMIFTKFDAELKMQLLTDEEGKVTVLQKEVEEARSNWEDLLEKLKQRSLRVKQLDELNKALEAECQKLQKDLQTNDLELRSSFSTISKLDEENNLLRSEILKLERQNCLVLQDLEGTKFKFESSRSRIDSFDMENQKLQAKIFSLEASISALQCDLAMKNTELSKLHHSQSVMMEDLCSKNQDLQIYTNRVDGLKEENISLRNDVTCHISMTYINILKCVDSLSSVDKTCNRLLNKKNEEGFMIAEKMLQEMYKVQEVISKVTKDFESLEHHVEELMSENKILRAELSRKDEVLEGLLFDLSLLQESASNSKDWKDEMEEMEAALNALQDDLALKSKELHETVSHNRMLEAQLQEKINMTSTFESDISSQQESLKFLSCETMKLRAHVKEILAEKSSIEEKLMERIKINESLEMELQEMGNALGQMNETIETLRCDMNELTGERDQLHSEVLILNEKLEHEQSRSEENEVAMLEALKLAESRKIICEEKDAEVKLLERSIEELECTINVLEDKVDIVKGEAERQRLQREELEMELHNVKHQMQSFKNADADMNRHLEEKEKNLDEALKQIQILEKDIADKAAEIAQCKAHISELNLYAEAQASEYKQKFKALEAMAEQVRPESHSTHAINASSNKIERSSSRPRGSGSPFKCIGLGLAHQMKSEKDEELSAAKLRIDELESLAVNRQKEILTLNARLAAAESMTHDVIRDLLGVKLDMTNYVSLLDNQQAHKITEKARLNSLESQVKDQEVVKLKQQLYEFIEERQGWLEEIDRKQAEMIAAQIALEKIRQQYQSLKTENEMLKIENVNCKKVVVDLEGEVKKLSGQQNIQQRIHHHAKIKDENNKLKIQNEELGAKLRRTEVFLSRMREELAQYRSSSGGNPYIDFYEEQRLNEKLKVTEEERMQLAQKLLGLCTSVLKAAGVTKSVADISPDVAEEALERLKSKVTSQERELQSLRLKNKLNNERNRLNEIMSETSPMRVRNDENCRSPRKLSQASFLSALDR